MKTLLSKIGVPVGVVGILLLLIIPVPSWLLDILIVVNILFALVILMTTMFVKRPLDFSVFPSLLLVATLFRLGLNVASTRLVLGEGFAGQVIQAFGHVAVGGNIVIGAVVFLILVVIQFIVVTKGAERVAEVGARFTLDAMPGKQMAIDADLNSGLIDDNEARRRRAEVAAESDFYGAMDGASKFVKGDAIAGIIIILINVVGGIAIGMLQRGMEIGDAVNTYTLLTIGDGLVTQVPALLMAVSTGMIVTRSAAEEEMGTTASKQLGQSNVALLIAGIAAIVMGLIPGMPFLAFAAVGVTLIIIGQRLRTAEKAKAAREELGESVAGPQREETTEDLIDQSRADAIAIHLAADLIDIVGGAQDDLLSRVKALRKQIAQGMGFIFPKVRTRDDRTLPMGQYSIHIAGVEVGRGDAPQGRLLALGGALESLPGDTVVEPAHGLSGKWIPAEMKRTAEIAGATVVDRVAVVVTHLNQVIVNNAARLLSREDVRVLTDSVKATNPSAVEELTPNPLSLAEVQRVLQGLLEERVPINDLSRIYEAVSLRARSTTDPEQLIETARRAVAPAILKPLVKDGTLNVVMVDPALEMHLTENLRPTANGSELGVAPDMVNGLLVSLEHALTGVATKGLTACLVTGSTLRPAIARLVAQQPRNRIPVLSYEEASSVPNLSVSTVEVIRVSEHAHA